MTISAIVAISNNRVIGSDNDIPWYLPADLKYFKKTTLNHHIIMGRKTFQSIGRPLPKRTNIVLTRDIFFTASNCLITHTLEQALSIATENGEEEVFIIGGGQVYELAMPYLDKIYLTTVAIDIPEDKPIVKFPTLSDDEWQVVSSKAHQPDEKNAYAYTFKVLERKEELINKG